MVSMTKTLEIWPRGYAAEGGLTKVTVPLDADNNAEARKVGMFATIYRVVDNSIPPRPVEHFSEEYIREMSQGG